MRAHQGAAQGAPIFLEKPTLRGVLHHWAAAVALGAGLVLVAMAPTPRASIAALVYSLCLVLLFSVSALYHRPNWPPRTREVMRRLDHSCIFIFIAGTYTPVSLLALPSPVGDEVLGVVWVGALLGLLRVQLWRTAPRFITIAPYLLLGWLAAFYFREMQAALSSGQLLFLLLGGAAYSSGAIVYALKRPEPIPGVFGHHEVFHALTIVACACHFWVVLTLVRAA